MRSKTPERLLVLGILSAAAVLAQDAPLPGGSVSFPLPNDSPVASLGFSTGESRATARGAAMVLDLHLSVPLRNISNKRIRGITLRVVSQEVTLGGKGSVSMTGLNVGPGEVVPVRIDRPLIRPTQVAGGPLVEMLSGWRALPGSFVLWTRPPEFTAHHDGLGDGSATRPGLLQARPGGIGPRRIETRDGG